MAKPTKLRTKNPLKSGWTRWQTPVMDGYLMGCCDCGLVHEMEFEVLKVDGPVRKNGYWTGKGMDKKKYRVRMRAKRHDNQGTPT